MESNELNILEKTGDFKESNMAYSVVHHELAYIGTTLVIVS